LRGIMGDQAELCVNYPNIPGIGAYQVLIDSMAGRKSNRLVCAGALVWAIFFKIAVTYGFIEKFVDCRYYRLYHKYKKIDYCHRLAFQYIH
jgi:hypothetical protein